MYKFFMSIAFVVVASLTAIAQTNEAVKITIGDKAPALRYGSWLKGTPINQFEPGRLYIVEFWATWCGPCIGMMPHLSQLAKEREKEVTVIGVNIWESHGDSTQAYSTFLPKVERFIKGMGDKMAYNVITDTDDEYMSNNWMKAAGQEGIPCSFMIKDGTILWIGHPIALDSMISIVNSPNYDVAAARKAAIKKAKPTSEEDQLRTTMKLYQDAVKAKDFNEAFRILDEQIARNLMNASAYSYFKFETLFNNIGEDSAMNFLRKWQKGYGGIGFTNSVGVMICKKTGLKKESYKYGIALLQTTIDKGNSIPPIWYNNIAEGYYHMGDYKSAVKIQEKAIKLAKQAIKEGKYVGYILDDTIKEYEKNLADYKKLK